MGLDLEDPVPRRAFHRELALCQVHHQPARGDLRVGDTPPSQAVAGTGVSPFDIELEPVVEQRSRGVASYKLRTI
jgi:hypothetical protein